MNEIIFLTPDLSTELPLLYVDAGIPAGFPSPAQDYADGILDLNKELIQHPAATFYAKVVGDSMEPELPDRSLLLFKRYKQNETPEDGDIIFCRYDNGFKIKKFQKLNDSYFVLVSNNKKHAPILVDEHVDFAPKGKFIAIINKTTL